MPTRHPRPTRTWFAAAMAATLLFCLPRAGADPAPQCGSRLRTALVELTSAGRQAHTARADQSLERLARSLHLSMFAEVAHQAATVASEHETVAAQTAVETLLGDPPAAWPADAGPLPRCPSA